MLKRFMVYLIIGRGYLALCENAGGAAKDANQDLSPRIEKGVAEAEKDLDEKEDKEQKAKERAEKLRTEMFQTKDEEERNKKLAEVRAANKDVADAGKAREAAQKTLLDRMAVENVQQAQARVLENNPVGSQANEAKPISEGKASPAGAGEAKPLGQPDALNYNGEKWTKGSDGQYRNSEGAVAKFDNDGNQKALQGPDSKFSSPLNPTQKSGFQEPPAPSVSSGQSPSTPQDPYTNAMRITPDSKSLMTGQQVNGGEQQLGLYKSGVEMTSRQDGSSHKMDLFSNNGGNSGIAVEKGTNLVREFRYDASTKSYDFGAIPRGQSNAAIGKIGSAGVLEPYLPPAGYNNVTDYNQLNAATKYNIPNRNLSRQIATIPPVLPPVKRK